VGDDVHTRRRERDDSLYDYDLLVIGSGPGGQKAAIGAAKLGKRVAVAERRDMMGGVCGSSRCRTRWSWWALE